MGMNLDKVKAARAARKLEPLPIPAGELCDRLQDLYTAAVNDVLREHGLLHQTLPQTITPLKVEMKAAGIAFTVKGCKDLSLEGEMEQRAAMLEAMPENSVVVWDTSGDDESAQWGEVMTMAAMKRGCRGAVVDGGVRDTDRVLEMGFPVWVKYRTSNGMLGRFRMTGYQVPVQIGGVMIHVGDVIFADIDGALVIPREMAYDVLLRAEEIKANESEIKKWVRDGLSAQQVIDRGGYF